MIRTTKIAAAFIIGVAGTLFFLDNLLNLEAAYGAVAGIVSAIEAGGTSVLALRARRVRPFLTYAHLLLFWPLPVLLIFHILSVYLY